MTIETKRTALT